jgi:NADPH:quinone reductase-like Zn-dependent oxidoreductase
LAFELMFTRPALGVEMEKQGLILNQVAELLDNGTLETTLTQLLSWQEVVQAHETIEAGHAIGKIVLEID